MSSFKVGQAPWETANNLPTAHSAKPSKLVNPVPGAEAKQMVAQAEPESIPVGSAPWETEEAAAPIAEPTPDQFAPDSQWNNPADIVRDNINQFNPDNMIDRIRSGLAANDTEKMGYLEKKYGKGNVAMKDEKIYFRRSPEEKLRRLDPATFELMSDLIPDFMREIVMEGAMAPAELGGAAMFSPAGPGGAAAGAIGGRVASVPMANAVADAAAGAAGVPRDPSRNAMTENLIGMGAEAAFPVVAGKVIGAVAKRIPGTLAYKAAKEAGEKEVVALTRSSNEVLEAAADLEREGLNVPMMLHQLHPDDPKVVELTKGMESHAPFLNKQTEFAEGYGKQLENTLTEIARRGGQGPVAPGKIAGTLTDAVSTLDRAEGKAIGNFKAKAIAKTGNQKQPLPEELNQEITGLMRELGFTPRRRVREHIVRPGSLEGVGKRGLEDRKIVEQIDWIPPKDLQPILGAKGLTKTGEVRSLVNALSELAKKTQGDGARLTDLDRLVTLVGDLNPKLRGTAAGSTWGRLTAGLRQHRRQVIGEALGDPTEKALFNRTMDDFSALRTNTEQLSTVLRGDVTSRTLVNSFFKGKENLANIRAIKSLVGKDSAEWGSLKEEFIDQLMLKHSSDGPTGFKSEAFLNDLKKNYGDDFIREVLNDGKSGPNYDTVKNLLTMGKRIEATQKNVKLDTLDAKQEKALAEGFFGALLHSPYRMVKGAGQFLFNATGNKENAFLELVNRDGFEKYLTGFKADGRVKAEIARKIETLQTRYNAGRAAHKKTAEALDIGKDIVKRGTKATIREDVMRD